MAFRFLSLLLLASAAEAIIDAGSKILARTDAEVVIQFEVSANAIVAASSTATVPTANFTHDDGTVTVTLQYGTEVKSITDAEVTTVGTDKVVTFLPPAEISIGTVLLTLPLAYAATDSSHAFVLDFDNSITATVAAYDAAKECTCETGGQAGSDLSANMKCDTAIGTADSAILTFVYSTDFKFVESGLEGAYNILPATSKLDLQINGATAVLPGFSRDPASSVVAAISMRPATEIAADTSFAMTMGKTADADYTGYATDFTITCNTVIYCTSTDDSHSVGKVDLCTSSASRIGVSIFTLLIASVSTLL